MAPGAKAVTEFDIFDAGPAFVEAPDSLEYVAPDRPARAPERERLFAGTLVGVVMQKVLVLREEVRLRRRVVVRADDCRERSVALELVLHEADDLGPDGDVGVNEEENLTTRLTSACVPRRRGPATTAQLQDGGAEATCDL